MKMPLHSTTFFTLCSFIFLFLLTSCAGIVKPIEEPEITIADIQMEEVRNMETVFLIQLRVMNPNNAALEIEGINCNLEFDGNHFATGIAGPQEKVPAYGTALIPVKVYASVLGMVSSVIDLIQTTGKPAATNKPMGYKLSGHIRLANSGLQKKVPFTSSGELSLNGLSPRP